ncbi:MAG: biotin--[acetyl-CoA-carboxylase] ligase [Desulfamplus sp.]|nr:biotin--[acetyl-CoA-carboxylase] ligase [Desulfamplus sp.]
MKTKILDILIKAGGATVSGPEISLALNISRVAVWKQIKQLKDMGYPVASGPRGYLLDMDSDIPMPFYFKGREDMIHYFPVLGSTMDKARELAREGAPHMTVVIAGEQESGRGRLCRKWFSSRGGLWFTLVVRPNLPPTMAWQVNFAASTALASTIRREFHMDVRLKWPNDLLFDDKKLAGLLSEMETYGDMISFVAIGIGLNVNNSPSRDEPNAVSMGDILGEKVDRRILLSAFLDGFESTLSGHGIPVPCRGVPGDGESCNRGSCVYSGIDYPGNEGSTGPGLGHPSIVDSWKRMTGTIGRDVRIETYDETFEGLAVDVDDSGALVIRQEDGFIRKINHGDCFHRNGKGKL